MSSTLGTVSLDPSFANGGIKSIILPNGESAHITAMTTDATGMIYAVGFERRAGANLWITRFNAQGASDTTFGENGFVIDKFVPEDRSSVKSVSILKSGGILVTGYTSLRETALALYNPSGNPNLVFGQNGKVVLRERPEDQQGMHILAHGRALKRGTSAGAVELPNNRLLVPDVDGEGPGIPLTAMVYRLNPDGSLDKTLNGKGYVTVRDDRFEHTTIDQLLVQPDGKWLGAGHVLNSDSRRTMLFRYNADGSPDSSFGQAGTGIELIETAPNDITGLVRQEDGRIVVATYEFADAYTGVVLGRLANGREDPDFNNGRPLRLNFDQLQTALYTAALDADGRIVVAGGSIRKSDEPLLTAVARVSPTGQQDPTFNDSGFLHLQIGTGKTRAEALLIQPDGKLLLGISSDDGAHVIRLMER